MDFKYKKTKRIIMDIMVFLFFSVVLGMPLLSAYNGRLLFPGGFFAPWCFLLLVCCFLQLANLTGKKRMSPVRLSDQGITGFCESKKSRLIVSGRVKTLFWDEITETASFDSTAPEAFPMNGKNGMKFSTENEMILVWSNLNDYEEFREKVLQLRIQKADQADQAGQPKPREVQMHTEEHLKKLSNKCAIRASLMMLASMPLFYFAASKYGANLFLELTNGHISKVAYLISIIFISIITIFYCVNISVKINIPNCNVCGNRLIPLNRVISTGKCQKCNNKVVDNSPT